jgi:hypothetical protein
MVCLRSRFQEQSQRKRSRHPWLPHKSRSFRGPSRCRHSRRRTSRRSMAESHRDLVRIHQPERLFIKSCHSSSHWIYLRDDRRRFLDHTTFNRTKCFFRNRTFSCIVPMRSSPLSSRGLAKRNLPQTFSWLRSTPCSILLNSSGITLSARQASPFVDLVARRSYHISLTGRTELHYASRL